MVDNSMGCLPKSLKFSASVGIRDGLSILVKADVRPKDHDEIFTCAGG